jgi:hypothetical protein
VRNKDFLRRVEEEDVLHIPDIKSVLNHKRVIGNVPYPKQKKMSIDFEDSLEALYEKEHKMREEKNFYE